MGFFKAFIRELLDEGHIVDIATNENNGETPVQPYYRDWGCNVYHIDTFRSPLSLGNLKAIKQIRGIVEDNGYDLVHCHTPLASVAARQACKGLRKSKGLKVFYTAHGFHFYKGAPVLNWLVLFPIEWLLSFFTDTLLTINREDYMFAEKHLHAKHTTYIHGVGCDTSRYYRADADERAQTRSEWDIASDDPLVVYVAELNENKHQDMLIRAVTAIQEEFPHLRLLLVGPDHIGGVYMRLTLQLHAPVIFTGERQDVARILASCDVYAASSLREGLPVNVMEAMASGLPVVAMRNRGHAALVQDGETGFLVDSQAQMEDKLRLLLRDPTLCETLGKAAQTHVAPYDVQQVLQELETIYFA